MKTKLLKVNLEEKLLSQNSKLLSSFELLQVKEYENNQDLLKTDVLERVGLNKVVTQGKKILENTNILKSQTLKFNPKKVFHISQIESICKKYHLRFLPTAFYKGNIDKDLPFKINQFEIAYNVRCKSQDMYIIAPASSFKLQEKPKDPLLFYKINDEYFYLVHKWGNDLSVFRRALPFLSMTIVNLLLLYLLLAFILFNFMPPQKDVVIKFLLALLTLVCSAAIVVGGGFTLVPKNKNWNNDVKG